MNQVSDSRNGFPLLGGGGGHQRTGGDKKEVVQLLLLQLAEKIGTQNGSGTAAARAAGVNVLFFPVIHHQSAVRVLAAQLDPLALQQIPQQLGAHL